MNNQLILGLAFGLTLLAAPAGADWNLDPEASALSFVTVKNGVVAEAHRFTGLSGSVSTSGAARLVIDLNTVDTMIPIRDERMAKLLFDTVRFPNATFVADIPLAQATALSVGASMLLTINGELSVRGVAAKLSASVLITRAGPAAFTVSTARPIIVGAGGFDLADGVEQLREIAGLASITPTVPVTFTLGFVAR